MTISWPGGGESQRSLTALRRLLKPQHFFFRLLSPDLETHELLLDAGSCCCTDCCKRQLHLLNFPLGAGPPAVLRVPASVSLSDSHTGWTDLRADKPQGHCQRPSSSQTQPGAGEQLPRPSRSNAGVERFRRTSGPV